MSRKLLFYLMVGMGVMVLGGVASAGTPVYELRSSDAAVHPSAADTKMDAYDYAVWQERGPVETGSMSSARGNSPEWLCCESAIDLKQGEAGETLLRPGIDGGA